jgi:hypothetical protein
MANTLQTWEPMRLLRVGTVAQILRGGGGKLSPPFDDPGEPRKPIGQG